MGTVKLRILLCVLFLTIVSLVAVAINFRTTPFVTAIDVPPNAPTAPVAIGTPWPAPPVDPAAPLPQELPAAPVPAPTVSNFVSTVKLIIPVAGVRPEQLIDTFYDARSEGRLHDAIDITAPGGTAVLAAADGRIVKLGQSERGGN